MFKIEQINERYSEEYLLEEERKYQLLISFIESRKEEYVECINLLLRDGSQAILDQLVDYLEDQQNRNYLNHVIELRVFMVGVQIYKTERSLCMDRHIFKNRHTLQEINDLILKLKFQLWRLEFGQENESGDELFATIYEEEISAVAIADLVNCFSFHKQQVFQQLVLIYQRNEWLEEADYLEYRRNEVGGNVAYGS